jgi:hypothetical protein
MITGILPRISITAKRTMVAVAISLRLKCMSVFFVRQR